MSTPDPIAPGGGPPGAADDVDVIIAPPAARVVPYRDQAIEVRALRVRQIPAFTAAVRPLVPDFNALLDAKGDELQERILDWLEHRTDNLVQACAVATAQPAEWIADGEPDEFLALATAVFAVNLDFFVRRVLPGGARDIDQLAAGLRTLIGDGRTPSSSSSSTGTR